MTKSAAMPSATEAGLRLLEWAKAMDGLLGRSMPDLDGIRTCEPVVEESVGLIEAEMRRRIGEALLAAGYGESLASDVGDGRTPGGARRDTRGRRVGARVGNGRYLRAADWRDIYAGLARQWAVLLERFDLDEDAAATDVLAAALSEARAAEQQRLREAGHRSADPHDCFLMNCKDLGDEVRRLQTELQSALAQGVARADRRRSGATGPDNPHGPRLGRARGPSRPPASAEPLP